MSEHATTAIPVFDGHNDTVLSLAITGRSFFERSDRGHIDLPRAREGHLVGGFFAVWIPDPGYTVRSVPDNELEIDPNMSTYSDQATMPPQMSTEYAQNKALDNLASLIRVADASNGEVEIVTSVADVRRCLESGKLALELHIEGAEPIDEDLNALEVFARAGVRSIGFVWSRSNIFGHGVPFKFGHSPDTGPGLTEAGKNLVRGCNRLGILIDLSHLNEAGFWDVAKLTEDPLVATHSGVHAISPSTRNLTDKQLDAIRDSEGIVGVNFHVGFLRPDGTENAAETTVAAIADHVDYMVDRIGIDKVGLGSDFDGATMPGDLRDVAGLPLLMTELRSRGYDDTALKQIGTDNWLRIFERTWHA